VHHVIVRQHSPLIALDRTFAATAANVVVDLEISFLVSCGPCGIDAPGRADPFAWHPAKFAS
jgi:hypothetical protein